jgi:hypothetical protein
LGPTPDRRCVPAQVLGHLFDRQHGAIGDVAGQTQRIATRHLLADRRPDAIGTDQRIALVYVAGRGLRTHATRRVLIGDDTFLVDQRDVGRGAAGIEKRRVQIGAVDHRVGIAHEFAKLLADRRPQDLLAGQAVHHDEVVDIDRALAAGLADPQIIHRVKAVRPDLDAGADLAEGIGLFEHGDLGTGARKAHRRGQAADATAGDDH